MKQNLLIVLLVFAATLIGMAQNPILEITGGKIQGVNSTTKGVIVYKGIPYAAPPTGNLRWKAPQDVLPWQGVKVADHFGPASIQVARDHEHRTQVKKFGEVDYVKEFYEAGDPQFSEDCLYLNVWQPAKAKKGDKLPVAFWIHGGAFVGGYGYEPEFGGDAYVQKGVILVTFNYRLGILGFLAHPGLSAENPNHVSGNYGLQDEIKALKWVRDNIALFGGDPNNITIFGQSAGGMSVRFLLCSPMTKGMIARAIMQSCGGLNLAAGTGVIKLADYEALGQKIFPGKSIQELYAMSPMELLDIFKKYSSENMPYMMMTPIDDNYSTIGDLASGIENRTIPNISYMVGCARDDAYFTRMGENFTNISSSLIKNGYQPAYIYEFDRRLPGDGAGAFHSSELWYMFGTLKNCWRPMTPADYKLSEKMITYWTNFMKTGNPNGKGLKTWKPCTNGASDVMHLDIK